MSPTPDSSSSWGEPMVPAERITSCRAKCWATLPNLDTWARYTDTPLLVTSSPHLHTHGHLVFEDDLVDMGEGEHRDLVPGILLGEGFVGPSPGAIPQGRLKPRTQTVDNLEYCTEQSLT